MLPARYDFKFKKNAGVIKVFTWKTAPAGQALTPKNLTTATGARMQLRRTATSPTFALELTVANGGIVLGGAAGTVTAKITAAQALNLEDGDYLYDVVVDWPAPANPDVIVEGTVHVDPAYTR